MERESLYVESEVGGRVTDRSSIEVQLVDTSFLAIDAISTTLINV
jgi:hypothetical protein